MSTYYILVNPSKKEWFDTGDIGLDLRERAYEIDAASLVGWLYLGKITEYHDDEQYDPKKHICYVEEDSQVEARLRSKAPVKPVKPAYEGNFTFQGHWQGDQSFTVSEHTELYGICHGYTDEGYDPEEIKKWVNISIPLAKEWNAEVKYWYGDTDDQYTKEWIRFASFNESRFSS